MNHEIVLPYLHKRRLRIDFSERYNRRAHPGSGVERTIETTWESRLAENPRLFNGRKFRYCGIRLNNEECVLKLGLTDYKTYIGTHFGEVEFGEDCRSSPIGNVIVPETVDSYTGLLVRAGHSAEGGGGVVFPGGHAEPDMVEGLREGDGRVEKELWEGAKRELLEELWIGERDVGEMVFLGLIKRLVDGKVSMVFSAKLELTGLEVVKGFGERNDGSESDRLVLVELDRLHRVMGPSSTFDGMEVVAETSGAARLWSSMKRDHETKSGFVVIGGTQSMV